MTSFETIHDGTVDPANVILHHYEGASMRAIIDGRVVKDDKTPSIWRLEYFNLLEHFLETFAMRAA